MQKIIFLDIDGTLTESGKNVPPESAWKAIKMAQKKGHLVYLCTGRNLGMLFPLLKYGFDGVIASSGGYIICNDKVIYDHPMTKEQQEKAVSTLEKHGIYYTLEAKELAYTQDELKEFLRLHPNEGRNSELLRWREQIEKSLNMASMKLYKGEAIYKIVMMSEKKAYLEAAEKILGKEFGFCIQDGTEYGFTNGELMNPEYDKGRGVLKVCEHLGIPIEQTIGFGDSMNDKEMIETVALSVCMANGSERLKNIADEICPAVNEHGIYRAFEKFQLI